MKEGGIDEDDDDDDDDDDGDGGGGFSLARVLLNY